MDRLTEARADGPFLYQILRRPVLDRYDACVI
jgi:hypothetical protein